MKVLIVDDSIVFRTAIKTVLLDSGDIAEIDVAAIIDAVNESVDVTSCGGEGNCQDGDICLTHDLWQDLSQQIYDFLSGICLADLTERAEVQRVSTRQHKNLQMESLISVVEAPAARME